MSSSSNCVLAGRLASDLRSLANLASGHEKLRLATAYEAARSHELVLYCASEGELTEAARHSVTRGRALAELGIH